VKEDTLWHKIYIKGETINRRYIPQEMRRDILEATHNSSLGNL
jgi:hypothetical protein